MIIEVVGGGGLGRDMRMGLLGATFEGAPRCCSRLFGVIVAVDVLQEVDTAQTILRPGASWEVQRHGGKCYRLY